MTPEALLSHNSPDAARLLLGWTLQVDGADGTTSGIIVETEAYGGAADPASHAFRGRTLRTTPMFEAAGTVYVYLSYGIHTCMNLVTGPASDAQAVLIRAVEPTGGLDLMRARRGDKLPDKLLAAGPGRVGQAFGLSLADSGTQLGDRIRLIAPEQTLDPSLIVTTPRIGISQGRDHLWRFYLRGNPFVSRP